MGFAIPYVMIHISEALKPAAILSLIGGSYILALGPPISAIVFASTSGSAIAAWLGGLQLNGQARALEGIGVHPARYLWSPAWIGLVLGYLATYFLFISAMTMGGWVLLAYFDVPRALDKLTADFLDPAPSRLPYLIRSVWLVVAYAVGVASVAVAKGSEPKDTSEDVTTAMTFSVRTATLFVVAIELASVMLMFAILGRGR